MSGSEGAIHMDVNTKRPDALRKVAPSVAKKGGVIFSEYVEH